MDETALEHVGLTRLETKVYLAVLDLGSASAGDISSRSGVHRRSVYDALDRLLEKGLVTIIKVNNRREYQGVSPQRLLSLMQEARTDVENLVPHLVDRFEVSKEKQTTLFFKGKEGIKSIFDDQLQVGKDVHIIAGSHHVYDILPYYIRKYDRERQKKGIKLHVLFDASAREFEKPPLAEVKFMPEGLGGLTAANVYGNNVAIILWRKDNPFGILIRQKEIAKSYLNYWKLMWQLGEK